MYAIWRTEGSDALKNQQSGKQQISKCKADGGGGRPRGCARLAPSPVPPPPRSAADAAAIWMERSLPARVAGSARSLAVGGLLLFDALERLGGASAGNRVGTVK